MGVSLNCDFQIEPADGFDDILAGSVSESSGARFRGCNSIISEESDIGDRTLLIKALQNVKANQFTYLSTIKAALCTIRGVTATSLCFN